MNRTLLHRRQDLKVEVSLVITILTTIALLSLGLQVTLSPPASEKSLLSDDFSSYPVGSFPTSGEWLLTYQGAGAQFQTIVDTGGTTTRSLQLLGNNGNSAVVRKDFTTDANMIEFEVSMKTDSCAGGANNVAEVGFYNANLNKYYPKLMFLNDCTIVIEGEQSTLGSYLPQTWYNLKLAINKSSKAYNASIEGADTTLTANRVLADNPNEIQSLAMASGWAGVKVYFDDARVSRFEANALSQSAQFALAMWLLPRISFSVLVPAVMFLWLREVMPGSKIRSRKFQLEAGALLVGGSLVTWLVANYVFHTTSGELFLGIIGALAILVTLILWYYGVRKEKSTNP